MKIIRLRFIEEICRLFECIYLFSPFAFLISSISPLCTTSIIQEKHGIHSRLAMTNTFNGRQLSLISGAASRVGFSVLRGFRLALPTSGPYATSSYRGARARRLRLLGVAFVRPIMNSPSFVEGGSFLLAPSKLRSLRRRRGGKEGGGRAGQGGNL